MQTLIMLLKILSIPLLIIIGELHMNERTKTILLLVVDFLYNSFLGSVTSFAMIMISVLEMAAPAGVKVKVFSEKDAAKILKEGLKTPTILLAKSPLAYRRIIEEGVELEAINLGGMGINEKRETLYKNIAASEEERNAIKECLEKGIDIKIQVIPDDKIVDVKDVI